MANSLIGRAPKDSYPELLKLNNSGAGVDTTLRSVTDGTGNASPLQLSTTQIALNGAVWPTSVGTTGQQLVVGTGGNLGWATSTSLKYAGTWNAATNTPALTSGSGTTGQMYKVSTAGATVTQALSHAQSGGGTQLFLNSSTGIVPGMAIYYGATFLGIVATASGGTVVSVATMAYSNISGNMTFVSYLDGITTFNVGDFVFFDGTAWERVTGPAAPVTSVFGRTGAVTMTSSDVTTALGYTPASTASPTVTGRSQSDSYSYTVSALGSISGTKTLDLSTASEFTATITGTTTFAFTNTLGTNVGQVVYMRLTNAGSAQINWPTGTKFAGGVAPTYTTSGVDLLGVMYDVTTSLYMVFVIGLNIQ